MDRNSESKGHNSLRILTELKINKRGSFCVDGKIAEFLLLEHYAFPFQD